MFFSRANLPRKSKTVLSSGIPKECFISERVFLSTGLLHFCKSRPVGITVIGGLTLYEVKISFTFSVGAIIACVCFNILRERVSTISLPIVWLGEK